MATASPEEAVGAAGAGDDKELRLALVCYGGSSLAIYMHGVTKELHRLMMGSALSERGQHSDQRHARANTSTEHSSMSLPRSRRCGRAWSSM
jgi:hypothetical protein